LNQGSAENPKGFWVFAGGNGAIINSDVYDNLNNGNAMGVRGMASLYEGDYVFNAGLKVDTIKFDGTERFAALAIEGGARYFFADKWSAGPEAQLFVNQGDKFGDSNFLTPFVGAAVFRDIATNDQNVVRLGGRLLTDITFENQTQSMAEVLVEFGWGAEESKTQSVAAVDTEEVEETAAPVKQAMSANEVKVMDLRFESASTSLSKEETQKLRKLAQVLAKNKNLYGKVELVGHADNRPYSKTNLTLSKNRAMKVSEILKSGGLSDKKAIAGKGDMAPLSKTDLSQNRRVEIVIRDVKDAEALKKALKSIQ
jgi:outer membrane protein OmpA-like peptidoglycan-associated protein